MIVPRGKKLKSLKTLWALIGGLAGVDSHVSLELMLLGNLFSTECTLKNKIKYLKIVILIQPI